MFLQLVKAFYEPFYLIFVGLITLKILSQGGPQSGKPGIIQELLKN